MESFESKKKHKRSGGSSIISEIDQNSFCKLGVSMRSKAPSCQNIFGQAFTKIKMPISSLSVTKYKDLLAQHDDDPTQPDISLHIPIDNEETAKYLRQAKEKAINTILQLKQSNSQINQNDQQLSSLFMSFRDGKEINKHEFIRLHQENKSFMNLDFNNLYDTGNTRPIPQLPPITLQKRHKKRKQGVLAVFYNNHQQGEYFQDQKFIMDQDKKLDTHMNSFEVPNRIELSLIHNKDMFSHLNKNLLLESKLSYDEVSKKLNEQVGILKNMPKIRQYPIFKKQQLSSDPMDNSQKTDPNEDQNKNIPRSNKPISQPHITEPIKPLSAQVVQEPTKVRFSLTSVTGSYQLYWYSFQQHTWKPEIRELQSLVSDSKKAYLFGGVGNAIYNSLVELDLENFKWTELKEGNVTGNSPSVRFGHTCNLYKKNLVFFGGETQSFQNSSKFKECLQDVYLFNTEIKSWKQIPCTGGPLQPRKNHASVILGRNLLVQGGINSKDQVLKDMWFLDIATQQWNEVDAFAELDMSFHKCAAVYYSQRCAKIILYKHNELRITKWGASILQEGVYFFGGKNTKGDIISELRVLRTDCKPMQWLKPETKGIPPKGRYGHSVDFQQEYNYLVIHGGKDDNSQEVFFNDVFLLDVTDLTWVSVTVNGMIAAPRSNHSACIIDSKLIVFGGINLKGFLPPQAVILELDSAISTKLNEKDIQQANLKYRGSGLENDPNYQVKKSAKERSSEQYSIRFDQIPFAERIKDLEAEFDEQKVLINSLAFQNFKSFLPVPRFQPQPYSRSVTKKTTLLKNTVYSSQPNNNNISSSRKQSIEQE